MPLFQSKSKCENLSENEFDLHENEPVGGTHFHMNFHIKKKKIKKKNKKIKK